jgi:membrane-associated phospholipid phosphatase
VLFLVLFASLATTAARGQLAVQHFDLGMRIPDEVTSQWSESHWTPLRSMTEPADRLPRFHLRLARDLTDLATSPLRMNKRQLRNLGLAVLGIGAAHLIDDEVRGDAIVSDREAKGVVDNIRPLGKEAGIVMLGLAWIGGRTMHRPKLMFAAEDGFESLILATGIITPALKAIVGRERPRDGDGSMAFAGGESFPSGEVTQAFALASVFSRHYQQRWVDGLSWGLASLVAWQRIEADAHWASDVAAGAAIGALVGRWVVNRNNPRRWSLSPGVDVEKREVGVTARLALGPHGPRRHVPDR